MDSLVLKTNCVAGSAFTGKTKYEFWNNIRMGDILEVSIELKPSGRSSRGMYAPKVKVKNLSREGEITETFNLVQAYLTKVNIKISTI